jgi:hypothetical protein
MSRGQDPPVRYLRECSDNSLRHFEVSKLEHVANLRRELSALWEKMVEESALALLARWMIDNRGTLRHRVAAPAPVNVREVLSQVGLPGEFYDSAQPHRPGALATETFPTQPHRPVLVSEPAVQGRSDTGSGAQNPKEPRAASNGTKHSATPL